MLNLTDVLVVGYDGDGPVITCHLTANRAATILTGVGADGDTAVESVSTQASTAFSSVVTAMESLVVAVRSRERLTYRE